MPRLAKMPPIREDLHACTMCGYCVPVCPAYQEARWESASPRGRVYAMRQYDMRGPLDRLLRRHVTPDDWTTRAAWPSRRPRTPSPCSGWESSFGRLWDDVK